MTGLKRAVMYRLAAGRERHRAPPRRRGAREIAPADEARATRRTRGQRHARTRLEALVAALPTTRTEPRPGRRRLRRAARARSRAFLGQQSPREARPRAQERLDARDQATAIDGQRARSGLLAAFRVRQGVPAVEGVSLRRGGDETNLGADVERGVARRRAIDPLRGGSRTLPQGGPSSSSAPWFTIRTVRRLAAALPAGCDGAEAAGKPSTTRTPVARAKRFRPWGGHSHRLLCSTASFAHLESAVKSFKSEPQGAMQALRPPETGRCRPGGSARAGRKR